MEFPKIICNPKDLNVIPGYLDMPQNFFSNKKEKLLKDLWKSVYQGNLEALLELLNKKDFSFKNLDYCYGDNWTVMHLAASEGYEKIMIELIHYGGNINAETIFKRTPLHFACIRGNLNIVKILVEAGCDTNIKDKFNQYTAIQYAQEKKFDDIVAFLCIDKPLINLLVEKNVSNEVLITAENDPNVIIFFY